ncbi:isocitrate lyase/PEP mutase family protein [Corynebacterium lubricantis]|uniref:isocitrate lyase/PEP mutase family protein n=1 Tax=Corynebacterium lubricantis TaxID=541095 RepID=UPI00035E5D70|nr:isocitrate lyase/phosphoenolpyruvate mutase family protein [Corynebacterium lubricantis]
MSINRELAHTLSAAHASGDTLVLPTVWDVWSAQIVEKAGFKFLSIGSHPVANAIGGEDGEKMDFSHYMAITRNIVESVSIPVSVDVESGYGLSPSDLLHRVAETGAVGANIEDTVHVDGGRIRSAEEHAEYIAGVRAAADELDLEFVINGRTDAMKHGESVFDDPEAEAIKRMKLMADAGARSLYPVAATSAEQIKRLVAATNLPLNVTTDPIAQTPADLQGLKDLGVRRLTWGPKWQMGLGPVLSDTLKAWL